MNFYQVYFDTVEEEKEEEAGTSWVSNLINLAVIEGEGIAFNSRYQWWRKSKNPFHLWLLWCTHNILHGLRTDAKIGSFLSSHFNLERTRPFYFLRKDFSPLSHKSSASTEVTISACPLFTFFVLPWKDFTTKTSINLNFFVENKN